MTRSTTMYPNMNVNRTMNIHTHMTGREHIMDRTIIMNMANNDNGKEHEKMIVIEDALKHTSTRP